MMDKPTNPKPTSRAKPKTTDKAGTAKLDKTPGGGGARKRRTTKPQLDSDPEKKTAMSGGRPIDGALAQQALTRLLDRYRRSMETDLLCLTECRKKLGLKRTAIKTRLQTVGFVGTQATQDLVLDCVFVAEQALQTLMKLAIEDGQTAAVQWLASRSKLATVRPRGSSTTLESLIADFPNPRVGALWTGTEKAAGQARAKASRSPLKAWADKLLKNAFLWQAMLPRMPKTFHVQRWIDFQVKHIGKDAALTFPENFALGGPWNTEVAQNFVDEIMVPIMQAIHRHDSKLWRDIGGGIARLKKSHTNTGTMEPDWKRYRKEALGWLCPE
jgi:hypothetical protein